MPKKTKVSANGAKNKLATPAAIAIADAAECSTIRALDQTAALAKVALGDFVAKARAREAELVQTVRKTADERDARIVALAKSRGIDVDGEGDDGGKWQFSVDDMVFRRKG